MSTEARCAVASRLQRAIALPGYAALAAATILTLAAPAAVEAALYWPLLASLVVFGLPHGAVDHHVPKRLGVPSKQRALVAWYVGLTAAGIGLWWIAPWLALGLFLLVAAVHWGAGDLWFALHLSGRADFGRPWRVAAFVAARGLLPVALPLLVHPAAASEGTGAILRAVGVQSAGWAPSGEVRLVGLALVALAVLAAVAASVLDHRGQPHQRRARRIDIGELALLTTVMVVVPPVFAVGVYFVAWHAPRHVARLMTRDRAQAGLIKTGHVPAALVAWHREAAPLTLVSLVGLALLAMLGWRMPMEQSAVVGASLALIAALTLPHALVVTWMDVADFSRARVRPFAGLLPTAGPSRSGAPEATARLAPRA
ncbi:MAG: Brp/Blh family beta-carotene 15,15'-dioxygenase [Solirubrobacteraceae bacterium]|nr:Brp/Blh family beta-carotene 15,15'-dioxygenase [Solirubrobacteraceae bacterium]